MIIGDKVRGLLMSFLRIQPATNSVVNINEALDWVTNAAKNRVWYRGKADELSQLYSQIQGEEYSFWKATSTAGLEIRKIHSGLPGMIVDTLTGIVISDLSDIKLEDTAKQEDWNKIATENNTRGLIETAVAETLYIGDGAFKVSFDSKVSNYPILEFYAGDSVEFNYRRGRMYETVFKIPYTHANKEYILNEIYGYGYIKYKLLRDGKELPLTAIPQTEKLSAFEFAGYSETKEGDTVSRGSFCMAVPFKIFNNSSWEGRGSSIFERKVGAFDAFDEVWSQWMDAIRRGRAKEYIPNSLIPKNPETGGLSVPNAFDNSYLKMEDDMKEGVSQKIEVIQPDIPHDSYLATYITALDLCLQGIISPSTLGIDVKKLDNAEAQREKEKATLYTRNKIVGALQKTLPQVVNVMFKALSEMNKQPIEDLKIDIPFGEYANPSFETQVETVGKGRTQGIMSIEASVEELYGNTRDDDWKNKEVARLKEEQGITNLEENAVAEDLKSNETFAEAAAETGVDI